MAYSKSSRPYRRYSVLIDYGACNHLYTNVRAHDATHAKTLATRKHQRRWDVPKHLTIRVSEVFEGTVRRATS